MDSMPICIIQVDFLLKPLKTKMLSISQIQ
jgi:hypothetical protein